MLTERDNKGYYFLFCLFFLPFLKKICDFKNVTKMLKKNKKND